MPVVPHYPSDEPDDEGQFVDPDDVRRRIVGNDRDRHDEADRDPFEPILRVA